MGGTTTSGAFGGPTTTGAVATMDGVGVSTGGATGGATTGGATTTGATTVGTSTGAGAAGAAGPLLAVFTGRGGCETRRFDGGGTSPPGVRTVVSAVRETS